MEGGSWLSLDMGTTPTKSSVVFLSVILLLDKPLENKEVGKTMVFCRIPRVDHVSVLQTGGF